MRKHKNITAILALILMGAFLAYVTHESDPDEIDVLKPGEHLQVAKAKAEGGQGLRGEGRTKLSDAMARAWLPEEPLVSLSAGGLEVAVAFEFPIPSELQKAIIYDLSLTFWHLKSHEYIDSLGAPEIAVNGVLQHPDRFLNFTGSGRYFPSQLTGKIGFMAGEKMVIPSSVVEAYEEAWNRNTANEDKYSSLLGAIDRLNRLAVDAVLNPREWFFISGGAHASGIEIPDVTREQFVQSFGGYIYRQPSLLDVFDGAAWDPNLAGRLIAKVYVFDSEGVIRNSMHPLIHTEGAWRFFIGQPPT